jgi:iron complex transport system substrate-binding protein
MTLLLTRPRPDVVDDVRRREFLGILAAAGLLTACGSDRQESLSEPTSRTATWSRGPFGDVEVPLDPQRVVTCNGIDADFALALGLQVAGASGALGFTAAPFADYHADRLAGVERVVAGGEPNLEQVAVVRPDVILDSWDVEQDRYDDWSALAPTVNFAPVLYPDDFARTDWRGALRALGELFGRQEQAEETVTAYEERAAELAAGLPDLQGATYAAINAFEGIIVIDRGQLISQTAEDLGLVAAPLVAPDPSSRTILSLEEIGRLEDVDVLLVAVPPSADSLERDLSELDAVFGSPLWDLLPAVQAGRVVQYPSELYYASPLTAPLLAEAVADGLA